MRMADAHKDPLSRGWGRRASAVLIASLGGALFVLVLMASIYGLAMSGLGRPAGLALLALLAVVGSFFSFGYLSGYVRFQGQVHAETLGHAIASTAETAYQILAADGRVVFSNPAFHAMFGSGSKSIEELLATDPNSGGAVYRLMRAAERNEERTEDVPVREFRGKAAGELGAQPVNAGVVNAGVRWLSINVQPFSPPATLPDSRRMTLWSAVDITIDRTREMDAISGLERALSYYDSMPVGLLVVHQGGRIGQINQTLAQLLGLSREATRQVWTLADICPPAVASLIAAVGQGPGASTRRFDVDLVREDGRAVPVRLVCKPATRLDRGEPMTVLVFDRSCDDEPLDAVRAISERFQRVFHSAPFAIATLDKSGKVINANSAFMRLTGNSATGKASMDASSIAALILDQAEPEQRRALEAGLQRVVSGRAAAAPFEVALGADRSATRRIYLAPLTSSSDPREVAILYMLDTTEIRALELKFAQSQKMEAVGQLAGGIAHDFNNVLTVIIGLSDLFLQSRRPTDPGYSDIMQIKSNANRAAGMVGQLLAFSRKQTLKPEVLDLNEVVQDFGFSLNRLLGEKINVTHKSGRDLWFVKADRTQFEQILMNLAVNARDAMRQGGTLSVRTRNVSVRDSLRLASLNVVSGEYVLVEVEDTGTGMSSDIAAKVFEPFFTTKDVGKGTGLGLATVYGIVKQTNGYIFCDSTLGKGTTFRIYLPRHVPSEDEHPLRQKEKRKEPQRDLSGTGRVLLVEDEDNLRAMAARALTRQGYEVLEASTGLEALEVMDREAGRIDLVLSDVIMPEMDGPSMLIEMRKTKPDIRVIFMSGYPSDAFQKGLGDLDKVAFLQKPFALPQLAQKVKEELLR